MTATDNSTPDIINPKEVLVNSEKVTSTPQIKPKQRDHAPWFSWLIITIIFFLVSFQAGNPNRLFSLLITGLAGAYTYYIYKGGKFVFVFSFIELIARLFTFGYMKKLAPGEPKSQAWIFWMLFTIVVLIFTFTNNSKDILLGIGGSVFGALYTIYLYRGGRTVYVPLIAIITAYFLATIIFSGTKF